MATLTPHDLRSHLQDFQSKIGINFRKKAYLERALTHRSYRHEMANPELMDNERFEFFGDAILSFVVSKKLMLDLPEADEGTLSNLRSNLVSRKALFRVAKKLQLKQYLLVGRGEKKGRMEDKMRIYGNAVEAIIAAIYFDRGVTAAEKFIMKYFGEFFSLRRLRGLHTNYKSQLQEWSQKKFKILPVYKTRTAPEGFIAEVHVGSGYQATGIGSNKREAHQIAAKHLLRFLKQSKLY